MAQRFQRCDNRPLSHRRRGHKAYTAKEIDYFAIYVFPEDVWYIFPAKTLAGKRTIALTPHLKGHKYEAYMENWPLLTRPCGSHEEKKIAAGECDRLNSFSALTRRIVKRLEGLDR